MNFKSIILALLVILATSWKVRSVRICMFCDASSATNCDVKAKPKCTVPKCSKMKIEKCPKHDDICLASWKHTEQGTVILAGCFPLPPHSTRTKYNKLCKPWNRNGTYTCLCRRNSCNKYPLSSTLAPTMVTNQTTSVIRTRRTTEQVVNTEYKILQTSFSLQWILITIASSLLLIFTFTMYYVSWNNGKTTHGDSSVLAVHTLRQAEPLSLPELTADTMIFEGKCSTVWRGKFSGVEVAVKRVGMEGEALWNNECFIYSICKPHHDNVVKFIAASDPSNSANQMWLATEYCEQGSLKTYLESCELSWERLLTMARDITAGLGFLHSDRLPGGGSKSAIAHQDLKSNNVLIRLNGTCAIADFGLSLDLSQDYMQHVYRSGQVGTFRYMAPEKLEARIDVENPESFKQIDVYSLALIFWELLTRCRHTANRVDNTCMDYSPPYQDLIGCHPTLHQMIEIVSINGCRPSPPKVLIDQSKDDVKCLWTTIMECWDQDPEARLTAECVCSRLEALT